MRCGTLAEVKSFHNITTLLDTSLKSLHVGMHYDPCFGATSAFVFRLIF